MKNLVQDKFSDDYHKKYQMESKLRKGAVLGRMICQNLYQNPLDTKNPSSYTRAVKKSLDLGCNNRPRNPYHCQELYGVDLGSHDMEDVVYRQADLAIEPIPFADNYFDYLSAFDFLEHIPRILPKDNGTRLPFIEVMNEIWRVLKPGGILYAVTPAYPSSAAFQDPTHVNIITEKTHEYFCGEVPAGKMYGFNGQFETLRAEFVMAKMAFTAEKSTAKFLYNLKYRLINPSRLTHFLWELRAQK